MTSWAQANEMSQSEVSPVKVNLGEKFSFHSNSLNEEREFFVRLPEDYKESKKDYPVIYLLDANNEILTYMENLYFHSVTQIDRLMKHNDIPQSIIVGIPFKSSRWYENVVRNPKPFREHLTKEVSNYITSNYRTLINNNTLIGQSYSAVFVINSLPSASEVFNNFIAIEPVLASGELQKSIENYQNLLVKNRDLQIIMGGITMMHEAKELVKQIKSTTNNTIKVSLESFPNESHGSVYYPAINSGLRKIFRDYRQPDESIFKSAKFGHKELLNYYEKRSTKYQVETTDRQFQFAIFEVIFHQLMHKDFTQAFTLWPLWQSQYKIYNTNRVIEHFIRQNDNASAIELLKYLVKAMPESVSSLDKLISLYRQDDKAEQAEKYQLEKAKLLAQLFAKPLSPSQESDINTYAYNLLNKEKYHEAIATFQKISEVNTKSINALDSLAQAYETTNNIQAAITTIEKAISLANDKKEVDSAPFIKKLSNLKIKLK
ncbi:alpha/beta hydrolase-fold protein [bacterium]|nr:alpha/beta hydrolase-fold protein [bacterium]